MMRLVLIGFGTVGQGLVEILRDKENDLRDRHGFEALIVGVATRSRGMLYHPNGLSIPALLDAISTDSLSAYPDQNGLRRDFSDCVQLIRESEADVLIEASPTNLDDAQPALSYFEAALDSGKHIVTANKGPIALAYPRLKQSANAKGLHLRFEATVMAGTPSMMVGIDALAGCRIIEARGILNGTTNYMLTQMENGLSYDAALEQAQKLGYAETDPTADVEGWDAAAKVLILLATLFEQPVSLSDLSVTGITSITQADIQAARESGERYKLIAAATPTGGSVRPVRLSLSDPLAGVAGATNAITIRTDLMGDVTVIGAGAGRLETGFAVLSDLLAIHRLT